jgi:thioredoxin-related protein
MKQRFLCLVIICIPSLLIAQEQSAIKWCRGLSWQGIKGKAKKENKFIFVDCYATWCKPCKAMDKEVYTVDSVGDYLNAGFISVKVQIDRNKKDDAFVRSWYNTAKYIESQYGISAYPSYVFFSPNGEVVSKEIGYKDPRSFIQAARNAKDPSKQYFVLLKKYKRGKLDHAGTVCLIKMAQQIGDTVDYHQILNSYYAYLHKQKKEKLYTKENIEFVASTLDRSSMLLFDMFYPDSREVNKVMQSAWYSKKIVDKIVVTEIVVPFLGLKDANGLWNGGLASETKPEPDWNKLNNLITKDYKGDYADRNVSYVKQFWYSNHGDFLNEARLFNDGIDKYGTDTTNLGEDFKLNNKAWSLYFLNKIDIKELQRAIVWMEGVVRRGEKATGDYIRYRSMYMDTYANLLYKAGSTTDAIKWEELAISTVKETITDKETVENYSSAYEKQLAKMRNAEPTWPIDAK